MGGQSFESNVLTSHHHSFDYSYPKANLVSKSVHIQCRGHPGNGSFHAQPFPFGSSQSYFGFPSDCCNLRLFQIVVATDSLGFV